MYLFDFLECTVGSWGDNCSNVCPYPFFGDRCGSKCECNETMCHERKGCLNPGKNFSSNFEKILIITYCSVEAFIRWIVFMMSLNGNYNLSLPLLFNISCLTS